LSVETVPIWVQAAAIPDARLQGNRRRYGLVSLVRGGSVAAAGLDGREHMQQDEGARSAGHRDGGDDAQSLNHVSDGAVSLGHRLGVGASRRHLPPSMWCSMSVPRLEAVIGRAK
jgi:hypothetical protein